MGFSNARVNVKALAESLGLPFAKVDEAVKGSYVGGFARVFGVTDKGNFSIANIATSKKDKNSDRWVTDFQDGFISLVGRAHEIMKDVEIPENKGVPIRIINGEFTTNPDKKTGKNVYKNGAIFDLEIMDSNGSGQKSGHSKSPTKSVTKKSAPVVEEPEDEDSLPF